MKIKILIGMMTSKHVKWQTTLSLAQMLVKSPYDFEFLITDKGYTIAEARNYMVVKALNLNCDYILMIDSDMSFPAETLNELIKLDKNIVGVLYNFRGLPLKPAIEFEGEIPSTVPFKCKSIGTGLILIKTSILRKIPSPWFDFKINNLGAAVLGEDYYFCDKARENGMEIWCDPTLKINHIGEYEY